MGQNRSIIYFDFLVKLQILYIKLKRRYKNCAACLFFELSKTTTDFHAYLYRWKKNIRFVIVGIIVKVL